MAQAGCWLAESVEAFLCSQLPAEEVPEVWAQQSSGAGALQRVIDAAASHLGVGAWDLGVALGRFYVTFIQEQEYGKMLGACARSLPALMSHLGDLHAHQQRLAGGTQALPDFHVEQVTASSFTLHCWFPRCGMAAWVEGLVREFGRLYNQEVAVRLARSSGAGEGGAEDDGEHQVFRVSWVLPAPGPGAVSSSPAPALDSGPGSFAGLPDEGIVPGVTLNAQTFSGVFPFHFALDAQGVVLHFGTGLETLFPASPVLGAAAHELFKVVRPLGLGGWGDEELASRVGCTFVLRTTHSHLELKGTFVRSRLAPGGQQAMVFLGWPCLQGVEDMRRHGLVLGDLGRCGLAADLMVEKRALAREAELRAEAEADLLALEEEYERVLGDCEELEAMYQRVAGAMDDLLAQQDASLLGSKMGGPSAIKGGKAGSRQEAVLNLLDRLLKGEEVDTASVVEARNVLLADMQAKGTKAEIESRLVVVGDEDVNQALMDMLTGVPGTLQRQAQGGQVTESESHGGEHALRKDREGAALDPLDEHSNEGLGSAADVRTTRGGAAEGKSNDPSHVWHVASLFPGPSESPGLAPLMAGPPDHADSLLQPVASAVGLLGCGPTWAEEAPEQTPVGTTSSNAPCVPRATSSAPGVVGTPASPSFRGRGSGSSTAQRTSGYSSGSTHPARSNHDKQPGLSGRSSRSGPSPRPGRFASIPHHSSSSSLAAQPPSPPRSPSPESPVSPTQPQLSPSSSPHLALHGGKQGGYKKKLSFMKRVTSAVKTIMTGSNSKGGAEEGLVDPRSASTSMLSPSSDSPGRPGWVQVSKRRMSVDMIIGIFTKRHDEEDSANRSALSEGQVPELVPKESEDCARTAPMVVNEGTDSSSQASEHQEPPSVLPRIVSISRPAISHKSFTAGLADRSRSASRALLAAQSLRLEGVPVRSPSRRASLGPQGIPEQPSRLHRLPSKAASMRFESGRRRSVLAEVGSSRRASVAGPDSGPTGPLGLNMAGAFGSVIGGTAPGAGGGSGNTAAGVGALMLGPGAHSVEAVMALVRHPRDALAGALAAIDDWQFDTFKLEEASDGRALSCLAFALFKRSGIMDVFGLDEQRLVRFLVMIEAGYPANPYHSRSHAADVLRTLHVMATRGGAVVQKQRQKRQHDDLHSELFGSLLNTRDNLSGAIVAQQVSEEFGEDLETMGRMFEPRASGAKPVGYVTRPKEALPLLTMYLAAVVHDYEHKGVNNAFLVKSQDPLALLYNDASPMENHHVAAAFRILREQQYSFMAGMSPQVRETLRRDVIELVLATDMSRHFSLTGTFSTKMSALAAKETAPSAAMLNTLHAACASYVGRTDNTAALGAALHPPPAGMMMRRQSSSLRRVPYALAVANASATCATADGQQRSPLEGALPSADNCQAPCRPGLVPPDLNSTPLASVLLGRDGPDASLRPAPFSGSDRNTTGRPTARRPISRGISTSSLISRGPSGEKLEGDVSGQLRFPPAAPQRPMRRRVLRGPSLPSLLARPSSGSNTEQGLNSGNSASPITDRMPRLNHHLGPAFASHSQNLLTTLKESEVDELPSPPKDHPSPLQPRLSPFGPRQQQSLTARHDSSMPVSAREGAGLLETGSSVPRSQGVTLSSLDDEARMLCFKIALKCADLGHLASPWPVHIRWVKLLEEEMFRQGDREKSLGLAVSALMDRTKPGVTKSQPGFFQVVVLPLFSAFTTHFPDCTPMLDSVKSNLDRWVAAEQEPPKAKEDSQG